MQAIISLLILLFFVGAFVLIVRKQETTKRVGGAFSAEYRTDFAVDECMDKLRAQSEDDLFVYTCTREADGSFLLHFTAHRATQQPIDTLYSLRFDAGKQTVVSLIFLREAFGYKEPVFPVELLDRFFAEKLDATRTL